MAQVPEPPKSIPAMPGVLRSSAEVLTSIDDLPADATGALRFGRHGMVLIESRLICWAIAPGMDERLTELLRQQRSPPIDPGFLEGIFRACQRDNKPLGEALLESGQVTEEGLRSALFRQTSEAIAHIAHAGGTPGEFVPHARSRYDARFVFPTAEILAALGARRHRAAAAAARSELRDLLVPDACGMAFIPEPAEGESVVVSVVRCASIRVTELLGLGSWVAQVFELAEGLDDDACVAAASWGPSASVVAWHTSGTHYVALCTTRAASALLVSRLTEALSSPSKEVRA